MTFTHLLCRSLGVLFVLSVLLPRSAMAGPPDGKVSQFDLCSVNVKNIVLTKVPGNKTEWEFVITLNSLGAQQFKALEKTHFGKIVEVEWAGVPFGRRRLDLPIPEGAKTLFLGSTWLSYNDAENKLDTLNKNLQRTHDLKTPCGGMSRD